MKYTRLVAAAICGAVLFSVSACSDLTGVGSEVGDPLEGGDPIAYDFVPDRVETDTIPSETGFAVPAVIPTSGTNSRRTWRFLAGGVNDPLVGRIEADGYVDLDSTAAAPEALRNADSESLEAELRLTPTYLHGDSSSTLQVELFDLVREEEMNRAPADTAFDVENQFGVEDQPITSGTVTPTDSVVTLSLPSSWIEEHRGTLVDSTANLEEGFHGLKIAAASSNDAVVGFEYGSARLRIRTAGRTDSVDYQLDQAFTHIEQSGSPSVSLDEGSDVLLDGVGIGLTAAWGDTLVSTGGDTLVASSEMSTPLNRAEVTIPVDTVQTKASLEASGVPASFVRPLPSGYRLRAVRKADSPLCSQFGLFALSESARTCFVPSNSSWVPHAARAASGVAFTMFDYALSNSVPFSSFRSEVAERATNSPTERQTARRGLPSTLPVVVRTAAPSGDSEGLPYVTLVVTPL